MKGDMKLLAVVIFTFTLATVISSQQEPEKCLSFDDHCLTVKMQNQISCIINGPERNFGSLTHVAVSSIEANKDGLDLKFRNVNIDAGPYIVVENVNLDKNVKRIRFVFRVPYSTFSSKYKAGGQLYGTPFVGEGNLTVKSSNEIIDITINYNELIEDNGDIYLDFKNYIYWFNKESAVFTFSNLYYGDNEKSTAMHLFLQNNWRILATKYGRVLFDSLVGQVCKVLKELFRQKPVREFIQDY